MSEEHWLPVVGWENLYEVSDQGRVRSLPRIALRRNGTTYRVRPHVLTPSRSDNYLVVGLCEDGYHKTCKVHQLVLAAFKGPCPAGQQGCHHNDIGTDNRLENLRWDIQTENQHDSVRNGRHGMAKKTHCKRGHAFTHANTYIVKRPDGKCQRRCRTCARDQCREYQRQRRQTRKL